MMYLLSALIIVCTLVAFITPRTIVKNISVYFVESFVALAIALLGDVAIGLTIFIISNVFLISDSLLLMRFDESGLDGPERISFIYIVAAVIVMSVMLTVVSVLLMNYIAMPWASFTATPIEQIDLSYSALAVGIFTILVFIFVSKMSEIKK